jgi:ketosteroid isomerase-like protein
MKRMSLIAVLVFAVAVASAQEARQGAVQDAKVVEVVKKLELEWLESYVKRDTDFLERYVSDDYTSIDPHGTVVDKKGEIESVKSGDLAITEMKPNEMKVRTYGDAAVIAGRSTIKAKVSGQDASGEYRFTDVWVKRDNRWQAVASQLTPSPEQDTIRVRSAAA